MNQGEVLLELTRSGMVESIHSGHLIILNSKGDSILEIGDVSQPIYPRSAVKSLQASAMVRVGLQLTGEQLAVVCASHAGSERHLSVIRSILAAANLEESSLRNTPDRPLGAIERAAWADKPPSSLAANCSGKHAGMLATCVANSWQTDSYKEPSHPLQLAIQAEFENLTGEEISIVGIDGCGAPLFALSLKSLARGIHHLTISTDQVHQAVINACRSNPFYVAGTGRLPTVLMEALPGLFVKDGAEGVMVISVADGSTIAWKMSDGSQRGASVLATTALGRIGVAVEIEHEKVMGDGRIVGEIRASRIIHHG